MLQLEWVFITDYKGTCYYRVTVLARVPHACIINEISILNFEFKTANQPGFEPRSPVPKEAILTIELHSIDLLTSVNVIAS